MKNKMQVFLYNKKLYVPLWRKNQLSSGVMVALRILVPPVRVRILPGQQKCNNMGNVFPL